MADLKIPNLNKNTDKFLFRKKLSLRRKSKSKLIKEAFIMFLFGILIIYINYLIPNKISIFNNILKNFNNLFINLLDSIPIIYEIFLAIFVLVSIILAIILILGSVSRLLKIVRRKSKRIQFE